MSAVLRHKVNHLIQKNEWFLADQIDSPSAWGYCTSYCRGDLVAICHGDEGDKKFRFEKGYMGSGARQSALLMVDRQKWGVSSEHMTKRRDLQIGIHGTSLDAAYSIASQ